jgi:teichuronic acid biosynthesis glycosyltransferase TuaH
VLIPNGCDARRFRSSDSSPWPPELTLPAPIAGFVGHLNDRIDLRLLEAVVDAGLSLLVVGPRNRGFEPDRLPALLGRPGVQYVGPKASEELPPYFRAMDVGLVPYAVSPFNLGSFPLKTLEYLSAGLPVVATDLPATRWLGTDLVAIDSTPVGFAASAVRAASVRRQPGEVGRRQEFAAGHDWSCRALDWAKLLDIETATAGSTPRS